MSISNQNQRVGPIGSTAANAAAAAPNFAIPSKLGEPEIPSDLVNGPKHRSITDRELIMVQVSADFICACIALPLALLVLSAVSTVHDNSARHLFTNVRVDSLFPVGVVLALALGGTYRVAHQRLQPSAFLDMRDLSFGVGAGCVLALAITALLHATAGAIEPDATQLIMAVIVTIAVITLGRIILRYFLHTLTTTRVLVVGAGALAERIMMSVRQDTGMTLVGQAIDGDMVDSAALGHVRDLPRLCQQFDVHRVLVTAGEQFSSESLNTYRQLQDSVHVAMVPRYYELMSWRSRLTDLAGLPFLEVARPHLSVWDQFMKRLFDLCFSAAVLVITSPLLLIVAIGVKLSSPGPVFFHQTRLGRHRVPFTVTKFRSMTVDSECEHGSDRDVPLDDQSRPLHEVRGKQAEQSRITAFGAFLRRSGIDEIPQFINVFRGDMSVVGPRPFIPEESMVEEGWALRRFEVRPGITGLWQVSGRNDLTRSDLVQLDYVYVASWSLWWDLKIMWETPKTMARGTGAY
jgi:exopolysaccharide biosynthesis polyprenyl glycosylphosphotransferase